MRLGALADVRKPLIARGTTDRVRTAFTAPTLLDTCKSLTGRTANSGAVLAVEASPTPHPDGTTSWVSMTCPAADTFVSQRFAVAGGLRLADMPIVMCWVYYPALTGSVEISFTSDNFAAKTKRFPFAYSGQLHFGWNLLTVRPDDDGRTSPGGSTWTVAGGFLDSDVLTHYEIRLSTNGVASTKIFLGGVGFYPAIPAKGSVVLGFDAFGEETIPNVALPILAAAGITGYWAGDANLVEFATTARTYAQRVYDAGWPLITQGKNHLSYVANPGNLQGDIDYAKAIWRANGWSRGYDLWAYPLSANDATTDDIVSRNGYIMGRSGWAWPVQTNEYNAGPELIGHGAINIGGKTRAQLLDVADIAARYGNAIWPFTHEVRRGGDGVTAPDSTNYVYQTDYQAFVDRLVSHRNSNLIETPNPVEYMRARA